jgi:predicted Zn-ribbon and HTH transcriptional regulator
MYIAQTNWETSADGIGFMDATLKTLKASLEAIRDMAVKALNQMEQSPEQRFMRWKCKDCDYMKHFTRPVTLDAAGRCPRCKSISLQAIL